jgi:hypothetical protein
MLAESNIPAQFLWGDTFTFFAKDETSGTSSFFYMVQDQGGNYSTPGLVTINVIRRNRCVGFSNSTWRGVCKLSNM